MDQVDYLQVQRLDFLRAVAKTVGRKDLATRMRLSLVNLDKAIAGNLHITEIDAENAYQCLSEFTVMEENQRKKGDVA